MNIVAFFFKKKIGPFVDSNNELISGGNIQYSYEELLQMIFDEIALKLKGLDIFFFYFI